MLLYCGSLITVQILSPATDDLATSASKLDAFTSVGDMDWVDNEGDLYLADRPIYLIISGRANIFPGEVEAAVTQQPKVKDVAVVGLKDDDLVRRVHAIVESFDEASAPGIGELTSLSADHAVKYKTPRSFELVRALLRNAECKIRRSQLREERGG